MLDPMRQAQLRARWRKDGWTAHVTNTLHCAVHVKALREWIATPEANTVPVNKHGKQYNGTGRQLVERLLSP